VNYSINTTQNQNKMSKTLSQQLALHSTNNGQDYTNIYPNGSWTLDEYKELYTMIGEGLLVPHPRYNGGYMLARHAEDEEDDDGVMWVGVKMKIKHAVWYTKDDYFAGGHYLTDTNDENIEMINDWQDEHNVGGDPESDDSDDEEEQHNVGECECKDCKRIEAEDDSDEEDVECVGCGSPISGPWVCVKGHDWCPDCRPDLLEKPKCRDASTEENEKKANMKKWVEEQMNVEHSGISPEDLAGKILDLVESNESVPFFQECFDEYLAERGRIWEEKETFCTDDESEEEEVQGVVPCLIGGKQFLIDPINKDMFDYDEFMRTGEADWVAVAHKNANIQYL